MTTLIDAGRVVTFAAEPLTLGLWQEAERLLKAHWREVAHWKDIPLEPDLATYSAAAEQGIIRVFTVRADSATISYVPRGRLVGYALFFVKPNPHYKSSLQAVNDVIYLDPKARGITGVRFVKYIVDQLDEEGIEVSYFHLKVVKNHEKLMLSLGYEPIDQIWGRKVPRGTSR